MRQLCGDETTPTVRNEFARANQIIGGRSLFRPDPAVKAINGLRFHQSVPQGEWGCSRGSLGVVLGCRREFRGYRSYRRRSPLRHGTDRLATRTRRHRCHEPTLASPLPWILLRHRDVIGRVESIAMDSIMPKTLSSELNPCYWVQRANLIVTVLIFLFSVTAMDSVKDVLGSIELPMIGPNSLPDQYRTYVSVFSYQIGSRTVKQTLAQLNPSQ
uniref:PBPe domain-containing protein n=1 Tax=Panagrellus redivivus TaxID=6233 RepID=A0A7E4W7F2_PANRE